MYVAIDGDDSGKKIVACYLNNDEARLRRISKELEQSAQCISELLKSAGFTVVFCAADGVAARGPEESDFEGIFEKVRALAPEGFTFSAGLGDSLREAYVALLNAKCTGKDRYCSFNDLGR